MSSHFDSPHCDKVLQAPEEKAGVRFACPKCKQPVTVPPPIPGTEKAEAGLNAVASVGERKRLGTLAWVGIGGGGLLLAVLAAVLCGAFGTGRGKGSGDENAGLSGGQTAANARPVDAPANAPKSPDPGNATGSAHAEGPKKEAGGNDPAGSEWVPLFNGTDLGGWNVGASQALTWNVRDGVLVSSGPPGLLLSTRGDFHNFHLRAEVKINDGGNSGIFFRVPTTAGFTDGYEADINSTHKNPARTGTLRRKGGGVVMVKEMLVPPGQWFTYEVIAEGSHITLKVNGRTTADFTDPEPVALTGRIALQQHNPETSVQFRKIEVKELP